MNIEAAIKAMRAELEAQSKTFAHLDEVDQLLTKMLTALGEPAGQWEDVTDECTTSIGLTNGAATIDLRHNGIYFAHLNLSKRTPTWYCHSCNFRVTEVGSGYQFQVWRHK